MLLSFTIENWMSFRDRTSFSMVASRERQHGERIPKLPKYHTRVLPIAALYGGNASGKTNFFKALSFAKDFIVRGTQPDDLITVEPFRLDSSYADKPSLFAFELLIGDIIYEFSFSVTKNAVIDEKLTLVSSSSEKILYSRHDGDIKFDNSIVSNDFLNFAFKGTRDNQLFLTNSVSQKVDKFRPVYDWFNNTLELVAPDSRFGPFEHFLDEEHPLYSTMNEMLSQLDTGINYLGGEVIPFDTVQLPDKIKNDIKAKVKEGHTVSLLTDPINERVVVTRKKNELIAKKLVAYHTESNGKHVKFEIRQESDGSQRIIDILPAFLDVAGSKSTKVYVIDEVDRSLHTLLTRQLINAYLETCSNESRSQLMLTTHDVLLMDQSIFRRDEMWISERDRQGVSKLFSFSEYKDVRYDKDLRKSYLQGKLGGIPKFLIGCSFENKCNTEADAQ